MEKLRIFQEILGKRNMSQFAMSWVRRTEIREEDVKKSYALLKEYGLSNEKIARHAELLCRKPFDIDRNYISLRNKGISKKVIARHPEILGRSQTKIEESRKVIEENKLNHRKIDSYAKILCKSPKIIKRNYERLKELGLRDNKIATHIGILARDYETIKINLSNLEKLGLTKGEILNKPDLLTRSKGTIRRNYENHVKILNGKKGLAYILAIPPETVNANYQYLSSIGIPESSSMFPILLSTSPSLKRKKVAFILKEMKYSSYETIGKREVLQEVYSYLREHPKILTKSMESIGRNKKDLCERISGLR